MRLNDFSFPSDAAADVRSAWERFKPYIEQAEAERFVKIGVEGEGEPKELPGILDSIEVGGSLLVDDVEMADKSGSVKVISGWSDCDITLGLILIDLPKDNMPDVTRYDCLADIVKYFKNMKEGKPRVFTLEHPHVKAWGARSFIFNDLKSSEDRVKRIITCSLEFDEYDSASGKSQDRSLGMPSTAETAAASKSVTPTVGDDTRRGLGKLEAQYAKR